MKLAIFFLVSAILAGWAWVRFAPDDVARWHRPSGLSGTGHHPGEKTHVYREETADPAQRLATFDRVLRATPRTEVLAGAPDEGRVTYVTRTKRVGFPDYTTLSLDETGAGPVIELFGRARYGKSDLGVNRRRIEAWIEAAGQ